MYDDHGFRLRLASFRGIPAQVHQYPDDYRFVLLVLGVAPWW
jgi:hypothetical protein